MLTESQIDTIPLAETLEEVLSLSPEALLTLYHSAHLPELKNLDGVLDGKLLAFPSVKKTLLKRMLKRYSVSRKFIWKGKICHIIDEKHGEGINILDGNRQKYRFHLTFGESLKDQQPTLIFDYKSSGNPGLIQKIQGEIRQVSPDVWLGLEYLLWGSKKKLVSIFLLTKQSVTSETSQIEPIFPQMNKFLKVLALVLPLAAIIWFVFNLKKMTKSP